MSNRTHYLAAIAAFAIWGFFPVPLRALRPYGVGEILFFRILISTLVLAVIVGGFKRDTLRKDWAQVMAKARAERRRFILLVLAGGALLSVNWLTYIYTINHVNIRTASFSYLICPVMTAALGALMLKEKLSPLQWTAVGMCAVSCGLIGHESAAELGYSMLVAASYALYLISQRKTQGFDRIVMLAVQVLFSLMILTVFYGQLVRVVPQDTFFYASIAGIAVVFTVVPLFLNLFALNRINSATIGILLYINPIINFTIAFLVFDEIPNIVQLTGYLIILVAVLLFNIPTIQRVRKSVQGGGATS
ncbi:MAG: EamA family transporter [Cyclobacteriaceae bacterium]|nr:EamA family transporter [Cyclobacteriaceae bacterium]